MADGKSARFTRRARAALVDVSDTEWRIKAGRVKFGSLVAALVDVSDTEWRENDAHLFRVVIEQHSLMSAILNGGVSIIHDKHSEPQHSLMSAILNGGENDVAGVRESAAALVDVSDTEWRLAVFPFQLPGPLQHSLMSAILNGGIMRMS